MSPQQFHLKQIQRLDVRQTQTDRVIQHGIVFQQRGLLRDAEQTIVRLLPARADAIEDAGGEALVFHECRVALRDDHIRLRQHHLHIVERRFEERPGLRHFAQQALILERMQRMADAVPARQHHASLGPTEYPGDRAQILDAIGLRARCWPRSDLELGDLKERRHLAEERTEALRVVHERAVRLERFLRNAVHRSGEALRLLR